jgi:hypothetical protein
VPDEVSVGELARRFDKFEGFLRDLVTRGEYTTDQRLSNHRFEELGRDIADLRRVHQEDLAEARRVHEEFAKDTRTQLKEGTQASGTNFRQAVYNGFVPGIICAIGLLVTILLTFKAGK